MIRFELRGRRALVTGGASGIGLAVVRMLAGAGARVAVNHLPGDARAEAVLAELRAGGHDVLAAPGDVGDAMDGPRMVADAIAALGGLDFLVNNAGTPGTSTLIPPAALDRMDEALWRTVLEVNLLGTFRCAKAAAPALSAAAGAVVNVASIAGIDSPGSSMAYGASKAGVISLTKNLARALSPAVRVNAVAPGAVDSPWMVEWTEERRAASAAKALLKRRCQPEDLAEVILFLLAGAGMVTGQTLVVDGGLTLEAR